MKRYHQMSMCKVRGSSIIFGLIIGAALCVLPFFAADNGQHKGKKYKSDGGNLILEQVLRHVPRTMPVATLKSLIAVSKHVAGYAQPRLQACRKLLDVYLQTRDVPLFKTEHVTYSTDRLSAAFVTVVKQAGCASGGKYDLNMFDVTIAYESRVSEEKDQSLVIARFLMPKPECIHNVFCFGYTINDRTKLINTGKWLQTRMTYKDASTGKYLAHPFVLVSDLTEQERAALGAYFLRENIPSDQVIKLSTKSQYKLFNLFVCYGTDDQIFKCIDFFCFTKFKKNETQVQKTGPLLMSRAQEQWTTYDQKSCFFIESSEMGIFACATRSYIDQLKEEKIFVKPEHEESAPSFQKRIKEWKRAIDYLKHDRVVVKTPRAGTLLFYDTLSNTVRVITYHKITSINGASRGSSSSLNLKSVSEPLTLPDNVNHRSLSLNKKGLLKYKLKTGEKVVRAIEGFILKEEDSSSEEYNDVQSDDDESESDEQQTK